MNENKQGKNDLLSVNPKLASEWHPTKNGDLKPTMVAPHSQKLVWWLGKCGHEWQATIHNRTMGTKCPFCTRKRVLQGYNDLATTSPRLTQEWHPTKNGDLKPTMVSKSSAKKVWWLGQCGHEWQASIYSRTFGNNCPICRKESTTSLPEYIMYYYFKKVDNSTIHSFNKDGFELDIYLPNKNIGIEYDGLHWHKDRCKVDINKNNFCKTNNIVLYRIREQGLPILKDTSIDIIHNKQKDDLKRIINSLIVEIYNTNIDVNIDRDIIEIENLRCHTRKDNSLKTLYPNIAKEWHPTKNGNLKPSMFLKSSPKKVWWLGECGHEWQAAINNRTKTNGTNCPICSNKQVLIGYNDLTTTDPKIAKEWHPTKNGDLKPTMVTKSSVKKVWWLGKCGHEWQAAIHSRTRAYSSGCPICASRQVLKGYNDLATINPKLTNEWHPTKNGDLKPTMVMPNSHKIVWWMDNNGHEWQARICNRNEKYKPPYSNEN